MLHGAQRIPERSEEGQHALHAGLRQLSLLGQLLVDELGVYVGVQAPSRDERFGRVDGGADRHVSAEGVCGEYGQGTG